MSRFAFVQIELPGALGIDDGRYPVRAPGATGAGSVLVARTFGAPAPPRRRLRRPKPRDADPEAAATVPVTELTVIDSNPLDGDGDAWLERVRTDSELRDELVGDALALATRALAARRIASADPAIPDARLESALRVRVGYGSGDELVDGHWQAALELPREAGRVSRAAALRPQERLAAVLGGREAPLACEELLIRARSDLDAGRDREAALQIRVALEALLAERAALENAGQTEDLAFVDGRRRITGEAANEALRGALSDERTAEVAETVAVCERILRRRAAHG